MDFDYSVPEPKHCSLLVYISCSSTFPFVGYEAPSKNCSSFPCAHSSWAQLNAHDRHCIIYPVKEIYPPAYLDVNQARSHKHTNWPKFIIDPSSIYSIKVLHWLKPFLNYPLEHTGLYLTYITLILDTPNNRSSPSKPTTAKHTPGKIEQLSAQFASCAGVYWSCPRVPHPTNKHKQPLQVLLNDRWKTDDKIYLPQKRSRRFRDDSRVAAKSEKHPANEERQRMVSDTSHNYPSFHKCTYMEMVYNTSQNKG